MRPQVEADRVAAVAALSEALGPIDFPISKREAMRRVRGWDVQISGEGSVSLEDLLDALPEEALASYAVTMKTLDRQWSRVAKTLVEIEEAQRFARR